MFTKLERKIAFRYLAARRRGFGSVVSWVSFLGIMLGVATLIVVMSVMGGFHDTLLARIVGMNVMLSCIIKTARLRIMISWPKR